MGARPIEQETLIVYEELMASEGKLKFSEKTRTERPPFIQRVTVFSYLWHSYMVSRVFPGRFAINLS